MVSASIMIAAMGYFSLLGNPLDDLPPYGGLSCKQVADGMEDYFAARLPVDQRQLVSKHLADCVGCAEQFENYAAENGMDMVEKSYQSHSSHRQSLTAVAMLGH